MFFSNHSVQSTARFSIVLILALVVLIGLAPSSHVQAEQLETWKKTMSLPLWRGETIVPSCVTYSGHIYCVDLFYPYAAYYASLSSAGVGKWMNSTAFPGNALSCVSYSSYVYCIGGYYASLSTAGVGGWMKMKWMKTAAWPRSSGEWGSCVAFAGYIYCTGGAGAPGMYAPLSVDGIGMWMNTTTYPDDIEPGSCAAYLGDIYCVGGGIPGVGPTDAAYYAPLSVSGIGLWVVTTSAYEGECVGCYAVPIAGESCAAYLGYIYCVGGGEKPTSVYYAPLSGGGIGNWMLDESSAYPIFIVFESCFADSGYMYCVGGYQDGPLSWEYGYTDAVYYASIAINEGQVTMFPSYSILGGGSPAAPVFNFVFNEALESVTLETTPLGVAVDKGSVWSVTPNSLIGSSSSEQWVTSQATKGTATSASTLVFKYQHQYNLTMLVSPSGAGSASPGSGWQKAGSKVSIMATAKTGYKFLNWTGSGAGNYNGTKNPATIMMNAPITETANFEVLITITSSPTGSGYVLVNGTAVKTPDTFPAVIGSTYNITAVTAVSCGTGCQCVFASWSDAGARSHTITTPASPTTYTATFQKQYKLTISVSPTGSGTVDATSGWHNAGEKITLKATPNDSYSFESWVGTGTGSYSGTKNPATITMNAAITETANFS
jgi:hypothetical protein